ncbi:Mlo-related protein [Sesbania bispinosa]|nr:Mlo-related protein [Sesbania bispinosa]
MAGGAPAGERTLQETPTWAVAVVCAVFIIVSVLIEHGIHSLGKWFHKRHKKAMSEALEKIKAELMLLGFISLLLTFGTKYIAKICIPPNVGNTMLPCKKAEVKESKDDRRSVMTMVLARAKMKKWKAWEAETSSLEYQFTNDPARFRFAHQTTFVRRHSGWSRMPGIRWIVAFFRQFFASVTKVDYMTMRHGFINAHFAPDSKFDFQKYIKRSMEDDFKVVVGISVPLWAFAIIFMLLNVYGTKLELIIMEMAQEIRDRTTIVRGVPVVEPNNKMPSK